MKVYDEQDRNFMQLALQEAEAAVSNGQTPFGSVVVGIDGTILGQGHNVVRSELDPAAHAEIVAIRKAWRFVKDWHLLSGATMYTSCEPCLLCTFIITQIGFRRVVFAARGSDVPGYKPLLGADLVKAAEWVNAQPDWQQLQVVKDFMRDEALQIIASFPWEQAASRKTTNHNRENK